jgi:succinate dehydrogenase/fumarate reductase-like Fe-S protein
VTTLCYHSALHERAQYLSGLLAAQQTDQAEVFAEVRLCIQAVKTAAASHIQGAYRRYRHRQAMTSAGRMLAVSRKRVEQLERQFGVAQETVHMCALS